MHFPVEHLLDQVLNLFCIIIKDDENQKAIDDGLKKGIKYIQTDAPLGQPGSLTCDNVIEINDNYCEFLWLLSYCLLIINDCTIIIKDEDASEFINRDDAKKYVDEAYIMLDEALLMLKKNERDEKYMRASRGKIVNFHNKNLNNPFSPYANSMTIVGLTYVLLHEFDHFIYEHDEDTRYNELEADDHAISHLKEWANNSENMNVIFAGIIMALIVTAFINPSLTSSTYPDIDERIENVLFHINLRDKAHPNFLVYRIIGFCAYYWGKTFSIDIPAKNDNETYKSYLKKIKPIIINHKRKTKII